MTAVKTPDEHAAVAALAVYPEAHAIVQVPPFGMLVTPVPQGAALLPAALVTAITLHAPVELWQVNVRSKLARVQRTLAWLGVFPAAHCALQSAPLAVVAVLAPAVQYCVLALVALDMAPEFVQGASSQAKASSTPLVVAPHTFVAGLGVYPVAQAAVQVAPSASVVSLPHGAAAALVIVRSDAVHELTSQVMVPKVPPEHVAVATLGVYPVAQATVQVPPAAILFKSPPQSPPVAALAGVGTVQIPVSLMQVNCRAKSPLVHAMLAMLGV